MTKTPRHPQRPIQAAAAGQHRSFGVDAEYRGSPAIPSRFRERRWCARDLPGREHHTAKPEVRAWLRWACPRLLEEVRDFQYYRVQRRVATLRIAMRPAPTRSRRCVGDKAIHPRTARIQSVNATSK